MKVYPAETVRRLLETDAVTAPTRRALEKRLRETQNYEPKFFDRESYALLQAVCRRLIPQDTVDCAAFIDENLSENKGNGWRYDKLPEMRKTFQRGLFAINETSRYQFKTDFLDLTENQQDKILTQIQAGNVSERIWNEVDGELFFEELLAQTVAVYYAHPLAQEEIGYVGMADAPGWTKIKLNEREEREPEVIGESAG